MKISSIFGVFLILAFGASAQVAYTYEFSKFGELIKGPPALLLPNSNINIKIAFDKETFMRQVDSVRGNIAQALAYWESRKEQAERTTPHPDYLHQITMLVNDLESLFTFFHDRKFEDLLAYYSPLCSCQPNCRPSVFGRTFIYTPQPEDFIKELIDQYKLKMKCPGKDCDDSVPLCLAKDDCCDYYLQGHCIASGANAVINLYRRDGAKDLQIRWYNDHAQLFDYPDLLYFEKMISVDPAFANASKYLFGKIEHD